MLDIGLCYKYDLSVFCLLTCRNSLYAFFYKQHFISNARLTFAKNQAKAKQHPEAELLLFENHSLSTSMLSSKNSRKDSKRCTKNKYAC